VKNLFLVGNNNMYIQYIPYLLDPERLAFLTMSITILKVIYSVFTSLLHTVGSSGTVVFKALCYKPDGRGFKTR
jgi:hypothetical protein